MNVLISTLLQIMAIQDVQELPFLLQSWSDMLIDSDFAKPLPYDLLEDKTSIVQMQ